MSVPAGENTLCAGRYQIVNFAISFTARRAMAAWFKTGGTEVPNEASGVKMRLGLANVVLHGVSGVLAVYRVRPDNLTLRAMKRWAEIVGQVSTAP